MTQLREAKDSLVKASTPEPWSRSKTSNWIARGGGLPAYIQHISHDLHEKRGIPEGQAIQMAIGIVKRWARGGGKVDSNTRAAAAKAVAEWEALKAKAHVKHSDFSPEPSAADMRVLMEAQEARLEAAAAAIGEDGLARALTARLAGKVMEGVEESARPALARLAEDCWWALHVLEASPIPRHRDGKWTNLLKRVRATGMSHGEMVQKVSAGKVKERDFSQGAREKAVKSGAAMPDGSFPIHTKQDLENARKAVGRAAPHIQKRAKALGVSLGEAELREADGGSGLLARVRALKQGEVARLPDGTAVKRHALEDGRDAFSVGRPSSYRPAEVSYESPVRSPEEAAAQAHEESARSNDPASHGGTTRIGKYSRVLHRGSGARFTGCTPDGRPMIRRDGSSAETTTSWGSIRPVPLTEAAEAARPSRAPLRELAMFDAAKHARDPHGRFARMISRLSVGDGLYVKGSGILVRRDGLGDWSVKATQGIFHTLHKTPELAAEHALALAKDPNGPQGPKYEAELRKREAELRASKFREHLDKRDERKTLARGGRLRHSVAEAAFIGGGPFDAAKHPRGGKGSGAGGRFIGKGSSGALVSGVQSRVGASADGRFGALTEAAVRRFQESHGLTVDGVVGRQTAHALLGRKGKLSVGALTARETAALRRQGGRLRHSNALAGPGPLLEGFLSGGGGFFNADLHPRDLRGRFRSKIAGLAEGGVARLGNVFVRHDGVRDGKTRYTVGIKQGTGMVAQEHHIGAGSALRSAMDLSAGDSHRDSIGGRRRYGSFKHAVASSPDTHAHDHKALEEQPDRIVPHSAAVRAQAAKDAERIHAEAAKAKRKPGEALPLDTEAIHSTPHPSLKDKDGKPLRVYSPERQRLHERIVREFLRGVPSQQRPEALLMAGGPAAGKSTMLDTGAAKKPETSALINPDAIKGMLPEYQHLIRVTKSRDAAGAAHEESSHVAQLIMRHAVDQQMHLTVDKTKIKPEEVARLEGKGYKLRAAVATVNIQDARARAKARGEKTGRYVYDEILIPGHHEVARKFEDWAKLGVPVTLMDTNHNKVIARSDGKTLRVTNRKLYSLFQERKSRLV